MQAIASWLAECGLTMHPEKSKIVYCKNGNCTHAHPNVTFTFLGFTFRPRKALSRKARSHQLPARCQHGGRDADAAYGALLAVTTTDAENACRSGRAMQPDRTRVVELSPRFYSPVSGQ